MATVLTPAESLLLLKPNRTSGHDTVKVTLLWLVAQGLLRIDDDTAGSRPERSSLCATGRTDPSMPPHAAALVQAVRDAQPDGGTVADVVKQARRLYGPQLAGFNRRFICPALVGRGLLEQQRVLLFFRRWNLTAAGAAEQRQIERNIARARTIPALLHSDPAEAAAIALAVGSTLLLVEELRPHYRQLVEAMRAKAAASDAGGSPPDYWPCGDAHRHHDDQRNGDAGQPGDTASVHDGATGNLGSFDLGALDVEALGALDAATFDASFDASAGGGGDGGSSGGGNGGGSASGGGD
jgi:hypothetical protein